jgi:CO/xanthine dehydrogenase FAD-binding subunit
MKPSAFEYEAPDSLQGIVAALAGSPTGTRLLAGGQSLIPLLNSRLARVPRLIDLNRAGNLGEFSVSGGWLRIGAAVRMADVERSETARAACPLLAEALGWVANPQVRNRATIVGNLVFANRGSELPAVALALGARFVIEGTAGRRLCAADDFFRPDGTVDCGPREVVSAAEFPVQAAGAGSAFLEAQRRSAHYALIAVGAAFSVVDGAVQDPRIALAGASPHPVRCREAEALLAGAPLSTARLAAAADRAAAEATVGAYDDLHATADYRRAVAPELIRRTLAEAAEDAFPG